MHNSWYIFQGQENERYFALQAELEKQFSVLAAQLEGPVSEFEDSDREAQVLCMTACLSVILWLMLAQQSAQS